MIIPLRLILPLASCSLMLTLLAALPLAVSSDPGQGVQLGATLAEDYASHRTNPISGLAPTSAQTEAISTSATAAEPSWQPPKDGSILDPTAEILAWVGDTSISTQELFVFSRNNPHTNRLLGTMAGRAEVLRQMIENRLINLTAAERAGLAPGYDLDTLRLAAEKLEREALQAEPVSDAEVKEYYQQHQARFGIPAAVWIREVFFPLPPDADDKTKDEVRAAAEDLRTKLLAGANFTGLANGMAHTPELRMVAGDQGFLPLHDFPYLETATAGMKDGDISPVVTLPEGFQVFQLLGRREAILSPLEAVAGPIRDYLIMSSASHKRAALVQSAAERYGVRIQDPKLKDAWPVVPAMPGQL